MAASSVERRSCAGQREAAALIVSKPPLHRRVEMCLLYDGFFSFAVVRQNVIQYSIQCFQ